MYLIRDVDKALKNRIDTRGLTVFAEGKESRIRTVFSSPDELIANFRLPLICIESGYMLRTPEEWQPDSLISYTVDGTSAIKSSCQLIDLFYTYKIGFYVTHKPHCTYLESEFMKLFPNEFYADVVDYSGNEYTVPFRSNPNLINLDESKGTYKVDADSQLDSDSRIYRRDKIVTAQLLLEESTVESLLRPFAGIQINVGLNTVATTSTIATITIPTITFVEE